MIAKGLQNAEEISTLCREIATLIGTEIKPAEINPAETILDWKEVLESVADVLDNLKSKFFLKTNPAVPITNACKKDATAIKDLVVSKDLTRIPEALDKLKSDMEKLLKGAKMEGIIIT